MPDPSARDSNAAPGANLVTFTTLLTRSATSKAYSRLDLCSQFLGPPSGLINSLDKQHDFLSRKEPRMPAFASKSPRRGWPNSRRHLTGSGKTVVPVENLNVGESGSLPARTSAGRWDPLVSVIAYF